MSYIAKLSKRPAWLDPAIPDVLVCCAAALLPWSTSGFAIVLAIWLVAIFLFMPNWGTATLRSSICLPICLLPLALIVLAVVGTAWANVSWMERLHGVKPVLKFVLVPFLIYHYHRSERGDWVFRVFLLSCTVLMALSWVVLFFPELKLKNTIAAGVPVRNYIDQTQDFAFCMVALAPLVVSFYKKRLFYHAAACLALMSSFFVSMAFVVSARTALVYIPALFALFSLKYLNRRQSLLLFAVLLASAAAVWVTSPYMRSRIENISFELKSYKENIPLSTGLRLVYWEKSLKFFADAPVFGNGTGSIKTLFERDAVGKSGLAATIIGNPHNQMLDVAVQWGLVGVCLLYAMWLSHLYFFRGAGFASWIGALVVVQNLFSSLLNSHLFDFQEGWMYVLGVGVAAGTILQARQPQNRQIGFPAPDAFGPQSSPQIVVR